MRRVRSFAFTVAAAILAAPSVLAAQKITVGPNVQISAARSGDPHSEPVIAADPKHPERLIAGSHISWLDTTGTKSVAYVSFDTGRTWQLSLERRDSTSGGDASVAYGPDGSALFATLARWGLFRSRDGGRTWDPPSKAPPAYAWDREYLIADFTGGKYNGRVYMNSTVSVPWATDSSGPGFGGGEKETAVALFTSLDGGTTWNNPVIRLVPRPEGILGMSNSVVLSDGTIVTLYGHRKPPVEGEARIGGRDRGGLAARTPFASANYWLDVINSTDGGESWNPAVHIGDYWMNRPRSEAAVIPDLAVDPGSLLFKDRMYVVWSDFRTGRLEVMLSYSSDKGKTWSPEQVISDDRPADDPLVNGPDDVTPTVAVNKDGVVAVQWYDRRDFANNIGWNIRMRVSLDGGETWSPSVKVTDKPTTFASDQLHWLAAGRAGNGAGGGRAGRGGGEAPAARSGGRVVSLSANLAYASFTFAPGHNGAFVADAEGDFHPAWIDYRTGIAQLYTARVHVDGTVARNGGGDLADLSDLSGTVSLQLVRTSIDQKTDRVTFHVRLKNSSRTDTIRGPLKARVLLLTSENAQSVEVANSDNGMHGVGAVWDLSSLLPNGVLLPDSLSAPKDLLFQLTGMEPFRTGTDLHLQFVNMEAKILGPALPARRGAASGGRGRRGRGPGAGDRSGGGG
ncbi:MAG: sialidase family protein [Gemmatimonadaceae bacterium]